jgi:hypothetical protein
MLRFLFIYWDDRDLKTKAQNLPVKFSFKVKLAICFGIPALLNAYCAYVVYV